MTESAGRAPIVLAAAARGYDEGPVQMDGMEMDGPPPAWDVFAVAGWRRRWTGDGGATPRSGHGGIRFRLARACYSPPPPLMPSSALGPQTGRAASRARRCRSVENPGG